MRNLEKETYSRLIAVQNNAIGTNYIKSKIDNMQKNSKGKLSDDKNETINLLIYSKLAQKKYESWHDWLGKVILWKY